MAVEEPEKKKEPEKPIMDDVAYAEWLFLSIGRLFKRLFRFPSSREPRR
jgi:hypothetical protein